MQIYAHRAGRGLAPENTLFACKKALSWDIDYIDFDIGMTCDGHLVVTHDRCLNPDITREKNGVFISEKIPIYALTYAQLQTFNVGQINPASAYFSYFPCQEAQAYAQIPLLKEAIAYVKKLKKTLSFQIEIKTDRETASCEHFAEVLYGVLKEMDILERTEVQAFDFRCLTALQACDPKIKTTYLTYEEKTEVDPFWPQKIRSWGGHCWAPFQMNLTQESVNQARALGLKVVPWGYPEKEGTEFNVSQIVKLIEWGVDGIITDRPDELQTLLSGKT